MGEHMKKFFKAEFSSKKTIHPAGEKTVIVYVSDKLKKDAEARAEDELKFWDVQSAHCYKKAIMTELSEDDFAPLVAQYNEQKLSEEQRRAEPEPAPESKPKKRAPLPEIDPANPPDNYLVTSRYNIISNEFVKFGVGIYGNYFLASYELCIAEREKNGSHTTAGGITEFADIVFDNMVDAVKYSFSMVIDALNKKTDYLIKNLFMNDAKLIRTCAQKLATCDQFALFQSNKSPVYFHIIPSFCTMPSVFNDAPAETKPAPAPAKPVLKSRLQKPSEFDTGIIYAGKVDYSGAAQNANAFYGGNIYCYPPIKETKPAAPAETKPAAPAETKPAAPVETKQNPDLPPAPDLEFMRDDGGDVDIFEYLLGEMELKPELTQLEKDIEAQNKTVNAIKKGDMQIFDDVQNLVYHGSDGISSTKIKDACISLMYYNGVYNTKEIEKPRGDHFDVGNLAHTLILEPEKVGAEYKLKPDIPEPTAPQREKYQKWIEDGRPENQNLKPSDKVIEAVKQWIEDGRPENQNLKPSDKIIESVSEWINAGSPENQRLKPAAAIIEKIEKYANDPTAPKPMDNQQSQYDEWISEGRPEHYTGAPTQNLIAQYQAWTDAGKPEPYKGKPTDKQIDDYEKWQAAGFPEPYRDKPSDTAIERCEFWDKFTAENENLIIVDKENWKIAEAMAYAVRNHNIAGKFINHPQRLSERSYYKRDEKTGLLIKARPDVEVGAVLADVKTIQMRGNPDEKWIVAELRREITRRKYHVSAAMYMDITDKKSFVWIFVNKEVGYHWVAVIRLKLDGEYDENLNYKPSLYEQGLDIYRDRLDAIKNAYDSGEWPSPVTDVVEI